MSLCKRICFAIVCVFAILLILIIHWVVYAIFSLILPPTFAFIAILAIYYAGLRVVIRQFAFPGSFEMNRRKFEMDNCRSQANDIGRSVSSFKGII